MKQQDDIEKAKYLDSMIPLRGASHADVISYSVDVPMRYAECCATLKDGRTVRLKDSRQLIGWSEQEGDRSLLFRSCSGRILIPSGRARFNGSNKFIARDGSLMFVRRLGRDIAQGIGLSDGLAV